MANNQLIASDNFASGSLAAGWSAWPGLSESVILVGTPNVTQPSTTSAAQGEYWAGNSFPTDQVCEVTINNLAATGNATITLAVRFQNVGNHSQGYSCVLNPTISSSSITINRYDAGVATGLKTITGITSYAAGDIVTFAAIGSVLVLYKNYVYLGSIADATYTSGSCAMFVLSNSSAASSAQISSFRGYGITQQDGIWTKYGCVLPENATEIGSSPVGNTGFCGVSFGPARFLSGSVWRGYFAYGTNVGYAESADGKIWQRYPSNPIASLAGYVGIDVFQYNGTFYLWAQATQGSSTATLFTSTDGLNWTNKGDTNLPSGAGTYYGLHIADVIGGKFYGLFSKLAGGSGNKPSTFLATSPVSDGLTWTVQNSGNAIIVGTFCGCQIAKVGNSHYFWASQNQPGQSASNFDPYCAVRYETSDPLLLSWTAQTRSVQNILLSDSVNSIKGGVAAASVVDVGGKAYMYYQGSPLDATSPQNYQTMLAIAPGPIASIVTANEDGLQQTQTDAFTSGAGNLDSNWTTPTGGTALKIVAGPYVEPTATNTVCQAVFTGGSFNASQFSTIVLQTLTGTLAQSIIITGVRMSTTALTGYEGWILSPSGTSDAALSIRKRVAGTPTQIGPTATITPSVGDSFTLSVVTGSDGFPVLSLYQNDFLILQVQDQSSTPITSGNPGMAAYSVLAIADAQISSWSGGNANIIPTYPSMASWLQGHRGFINKRGMKF